MRIKIGEKEVKEWADIAQEFQCDLEKDSGPGSYRVLRFIKNGRRIRMMISASRGIIKLKKNYSTYRKISSILNMLKMA